MRFIRVSWSRRSIDLPDQFVASYLIALVLNCVPSWTRIRLLAKGGERVSDYACHVQGWMDTVKAEKKERLPLCDEDCLIHSITSE